MARILDVREICERALRKIGSYAISDQGARPEEMLEARHWLDMVMGHAAARRRVWWLIPNTAPLTMVAAQEAYLLSDLLPAGDPLAAVVSVTAVNTTTGAREDPPVTIARRWEWEARDPTQTTGRPQMVYVDRLPNPTMRVWPIPAAPITHRLDVVFQRVSPDLVSGIITERVVKMREAWNLWVVTALAAQIGNGPVRKLPGDEVRDMKAEAMSLLHDLEAFDEHEQAGEPRLVSYYDF